MVLVAEVQFRREWVYAAIGRDVLNVMDGPGETGPIANRVESGILICTVESATRASNLKGPVGLAQKEKQMFRLALVLLTLSTPFSASAQSRSPESASTSNIGNVELIADFPLTQNGSDSLSRNPALSTADIVSGALFSDSGYTWQPGHPMKAVATINDLNYESFTVSVDLKPIAYTSELSPLLVGGTGYRWISLRNNQGRLELAFNNGNYAVSLRSVSGEQAGTIPTGVWSNIVLSFNLSKKVAIVFVNGAMLQPARLPSQFALEVISSQADKTEKNFTFTDYRNAHTYHGYARNLRVYGRSVEPKEITSIYKQIRTAVSGTVAQGNAIASASENSVRPKPSFDCTKAKTAAARLICTDDELARLDGQLGVAFQNRKSQVPETDQQRFVAEQVAWIRDRNKRCNLIGNDAAPMDALASSKPCMVSAIQERISFLIQAGSTQPSSTAVLNVTSLKRGTYVAKGTPCAQASNGVLMNFDGDRFFGGHGYCLLVEGASGQSFVLKKSCPVEGNEGSPVGETYTIVSQNEFKLRNGIGEFNYQFCEQAALPEEWRGMVRVAEGGTQGEATQPAPVKWNVVCDRLWEGNAQGESHTLVNPLGGQSVQIPIVSVTVEIQPNDRQLFTDANRTVQYLDFLKAGSEKACNNDIRTGKLKLTKVPDTYLISIASSAGSLSAFRGQESSGQRRYLTEWAIQNNTLGNSWLQEQARLRAEEQMREAQARAQQQAQLEQQRIVQAKRTQRDNFVAQFGVQRWVARKDLVSNPFIYKGMVVGVGGTFIRMLSESEALIDVPDCYLAACPDAIILSNIPSTTFRNKTTAIFAVRVLGMRTLKTPNGETTIPSLEFVGVQQCFDQTCGEMGQLLYDGTLQN
jgi:uncharacterized protein YecT (DUF1311 family)